MNKKGVKTIQREKSKKPLSEAEVKKFLDHYNETEIIVDLENESDLDENCCSDSDCCKLDSNTMESYDSDNDNTILKESDNTDSIDSLSETADSYDSDECTVNNSSTKKFKKNLKKLNL